MLICLVGSTLCASVLLDAVAKSLLLDEHIASVRILLINATTGVLSTVVGWAKPQVGHGDGPKRINEDGLEVGVKPSVSLPWYVWHCIDNCSGFIQHLRIFLIKRRYDDEFSSQGKHRSQKFVSSPEHITFGGFWTYPYFTCAQRRWIVSYSVVIPPATRHEYDFV